MSIVINNNSDLEVLVSKYKSENKTIGFVPTMGGLHAGHLSLVDKARVSADIVVVSIFVNPTQFGANEDFSQYPKTLEQDISLLEQHQVDVLFVPSIEQVYPQGLDGSIKAGEMGSILCGASRPGHFDGVVQVVHRLFEIVKPDIAIFGEKDYQQLLIIMQMVCQYFPEIEILSQPIVREEDGLAMSTRNQYLSIHERRIASNLYKNLLKIKENIQKGQKISAVIKQERVQIQKDFKLDYIEVLDANTLKQITDNTNEIAILCAVFLGSTRLIDNIVFNKG